MALVALSAGALYLRPSAAGPSNQAPSATPVPVATVVQTEVATWDEFSGRLEAVERVDVRSRVAGAAIDPLHQGALVRRATCS
jgi:multidrug efflux system membrane fusion protein